MRVNQFVARATGLSRRAADATIKEGRVSVNRAAAELGMRIDPAKDVVELDGTELALNEMQTILLHKPAGYVVSRQGQGSKTIYDLLPERFGALKAVGRLDKDSSGLLILTDNGELAEELTHPRYKKLKLYEVTLDRPLERQHQEGIEKGVMLEDGPSRLRLQKLETIDSKLVHKIKRSIPNSQFLITMREGRNRQIRRTFASLGYTVTQLHRIQLGPYRIGDLGPGQWEETSGYPSSG